MYDVSITSHTPIFKTPEQYVRDKLRILRRDFYIEATEAEIAHLKTLTTQVSIDNAVLSIMTRRWN